MGSIGIFGGSFNPIHNGHLYLAEQVKKELELERIIFVPSKIPPHKSDMEYAPDYARLEMCRLAAEERDGFEVSDFELMRDGVSYTLYTVEHFRRLYPNEKLYLLVGSDMLLCFDKWFEYKRILSQVSLVALSRENNDFLKLREKTNVLRLYGEIFLLQSEAYPLSSTKIREMIKKERNFSCYLPKKVVQYIRLQKLYTD